MVGCIDVLQRNKEVVIGLLTDCRCSRLDLRRNPQAITLFSTESTGRVLSRFGGSLINSSPSSVRGKRRIGIMSVGVVGPATISVI